MIYVDNWVKEIDHDDEIELNIEDIHHWLISVQLIVQDKIHKSKQKRRIWVIRRDIEVMIYHKILIHIADTPFITDSF